MANASTRNRWIACGVCLGSLLLIVMLGMVPVFLSSRERLTHVGRHVADSSNWLQSYDGYYWASNDAQVVTLRSNHRELLRLNDLTGSVTPESWPKLPDGSPSEIEGLVLLPTRNGCSSRP